MREKKDKERKKDGREEEGETSRTITNTSSVKILTHQRKKFVKTLNMTCRIDTASSVWPFILTLQKFIEICRLLNRASGFLELAV